MLTTAIRDEHVQGDGEVRAVIAAVDGEEVEVRALHAGDGPALQEFNASLGEWTQAHYLPHSYDDETLAKAISRAEMGVDLTYLVWVGQEVVGYFFLWDFGDRVPVLGIGLTDAYQGRGLGKQMMGILTADAREADRDGIQLTATPDNARALALYRECDFQHVKDVENIAGDGRTVVERLMFLPLKPGATLEEHEHAPPV